MRNKKFLVMLAIATTITACTPPVKKIYRYAVTSDYSTGNLGTLTAEQVRSLLKQTPLQMTLSAEAMRELHGYSGNAEGTTFTVQGIRGNRISCKRQINKGAYPYAEYTNYDMAYLQPYKPQFVALTGKTTLYNENKKAYDQ